MKHEQSWTHDKCTCGGHVGASKENGKNLSFKNMHSGLDLRIHRKGSEGGKVFFTVEHDGHWSKPTGIRFRAGEIDANGNQTTHMDANDADIGQFKTSMQTTNKARKAVKANRAAKAASKSRYAASGGETAAAGTAGTAAVETGAAGEGVAAATGAAGAAEGTAGAAAAEVSTGEALSVVANLGGDILKIFPEFLELTVDVAFGPEVILALVRQNSDAP